MTYKAFISYSHAADGRLAPSLHSALARFAKPWYALRSMRVFRDKTSLAANPALWPSIEAALSESEYLLLFASELSSQSVWVTREIRWWLANRQMDHMLILLTSGELVWDAATNDYDWSLTTSLPRDFEKRFHYEPLWVDLRWARSENQLSLRHTQFRAVVLDLAAALLDLPKDQLDGEDVRQHRKTRRIASTAIVALTILFLSAVYAAVIATRQTRLATAAQQAELVQRKNAEASAEQARRDRDAAVEQRKLAEQRRIRSELGEKAARVSNLLTVRPVDGMLLAIAAMGQNLRDLPGEVLTPVQSSLRDSLDWARETHNFQGHPFSKNFVIPQGTIESISVSSDGRRVLSFGQDESVRLWALDGGSIAPQWRKSQDEITWAAFHPDARKLYSGGKDGYVQSWTTQGQLLWRSTDRHSGPVIYIACNRDGSLVLSIGSDTKPRVWTGEGKAMGGEFAASRKYLSAAAFSPREQKIVSGYDDGSVRLWNGDGSSAGAGFHAHSGPVLAVAFDPEGQRILSVGKDRSARVWYSNGKPAGEPIPGGSDFAYHFCPAADCVLSFRAHPRGTVPVFWREEWRPDRRVLEGVFPGSQFRFATMDGTPFESPFGASEPAINGLAFDLVKGRIVTRNADGLFRVWVRYGSEPRFHPSGKSFGNTTSRAFAMEPSAEGRLVATGGQGNVIEVWADDRLVAGPLRGHDRGISKLSFGPGDAFLVSGGGDATVRVWDLRDSLTRTAGNHTSEAYFVAFSHDGSRLVSSGGKASMGLPGVIVWTLQGKRVTDLYTGPNFASAATFLRKSVAIAGGDGSIGIYQGDDRGEILSSQNHPRSSIVTADADGNLVRVGSDGSLDVWNPSGRSIVSRRPSQNGPPSAVWLSPDGATLAIAAADGTVSVQDRKGGAVGASFKIPRRVASIALRPDGSQIIAGGADGTVSIWNRDGRETRNPIQAHNGSTSAIAVSPAGDLVVTAGSDGTLRLWDAVGNPIGGPAAVHTAKVNSVAFSPDGTMVASAGQDGAVRITSVDWRSWLRLACERLKYHSALSDSGDPVAGAARLICETVQSSRLESNAKEFLASGRTQ